MSAAGGVAGRVVLVTGAAERAGATFARRYAALGAHVVVNHLPGQAASAEAVVADIEAAGGRAVAITADITVVGEAQRLVDTAVAHFGGLDVLVHNASTFTPRPWLEVDESLYENSMAVNVKGPFFLSQAAARVMLEQGSGHIVAMVGNSLYEAWPDFVPHTVAKTALARLMEQLAVALAPVVACNCVAPAQFFASDDGVNDALRLRRGESHEYGDSYEVAPSVRLREVGLDAVFAAVLQLSCCPLELTGVTLRVDGGKALL